MGAEKEEEADTGAEAAEESEETGTETDTGAEAAEESEETGKEEKLPDDAPEWAVKRIGKLTAKRKAAEEERDAAKAEAETLRKTFSDADLLRAAKRSGIMPGFMTADEIKTVDKAEGLSRQVKRLEEAVDDCGTVETDDGEVQGYRDAEGRVVTLQQVKKWLRKAREDLEEVKEDADRLRKEKGAELRDLLSLGKAAKKAGWKPGGAPRKVSPGKGAEAAAAGGGKRTDPTKPRGKAEAAYKDVKNKEDFIAAMAAKYGG